MNIKNTFLKVMAVAIVLAFVSTSCQDEEGKGGGKGKTVAVTSVHLMPSTLTLEVGETETLKANVSPSNATDPSVTWESSDNAVASVNNGVVTALEGGEAVITVTTKDGGKTGKCSVTVIALHPGEPEMVLVEGGTFMMGYDGPGHFFIEQPVHQVTVKSFKMAKFEVTQKQWSLISHSTNPSSFKGEDLPVEQVCWNDVLTYIGILNSVTGKNYRLPTEAEWEYAARGGKKGVNNYRYSGGDDINAVSWYVGNSSSKTHPVGTKEPNELGIYDMSGNVAEWCSDFYGIYPESSQTDPTGPGSGTQRIYRGGSWFEPETHHTVTYRMSDVPNNRNNNTVGFRLVLDVPAP